MRIPIKPKVNLKKMRYGTMSVIMITAVLFSIVFLNMIFDSLELKLDLTGNKLYSLTDVSKEILRGTADRQITVYGMFDDGRNLSDAYREFVEILKEYNKFPNISVRYIDPDRNPGIIKELDPQGIKGIKRNDFVVQCGSHVKKLIVSDLLQYSEIDNATMSRQVQGNKAEQVFTSAIRTVHTGDQPVVYFTEGHAEGNLSYEYSNFREQLEINNFDTRSLNLMSVPAVPDDAVALIMLAPKSDLVQDEKLKIDDFLLTGGKLLIFIDYLSNDPSFDQLNLLLETYNLSVNYDKVRENDAGRHVPNNNYYIMAQNRSNSIIRGDIDYWLEDCRSVRVFLNDRENLTTWRMIQTTNSAVGEAVSPERGDDNVGPLTIAAMAERLVYRGEAHILVMGNSKVFTDTVARQIPNYFAAAKDFVINSLFWMIDIVPEQIVETRYYTIPNLEITQAQADVVYSALAYAFPAAVLATGFFVWLRRRHL